MTVPGVHIIPAGLEYDRVMKPLFKDFTVRKAYILVHDPEKDKGDYSKQAQIVNSYIDKMKKIPIEWEEVRIDIYNFDETFKTVYNLIRKEASAKNPVYVNISSAPKILQVALTLATFLNKEYGEVELFYVEPERYYEGELISTTFELLGKNVDEKKVISRLKELAGEIREHGMAAGERRIHEFPPFPLAEINAIEYEMLKIIRESSKVASNEYGINSIKEMKNMLDDKLGFETPRSNVKYYLDNLQNLGLVRTERDKKELRIKLTRVGELFADTM